MTYGYIYRTTCFPSGRVYIGQKRRGAFDSYYLGSGKLIRAAVLKHGRPQFMIEVLEFAGSKRELDRAEQRQIIAHRARLGRANVYNITPGGEGCGRGPEHPSFGRKASAEERAKLSASRTGPKNWLYGKGYLITAEKNPHFGKHLSAEAKAKIGAAVSANNGSANASAEGRHWMTGKKWSPELREKMKSRPKIKGRQLSEEAKQKIRTAQLGHVETPKKREKNRLAQIARWTAMTPEKRQAHRMQRRRIWQEHPELRLKMLAANPRGPRSMREGRIAI